MSCDGLVTGPGCLPASQPVAAGIDSRGPSIRAMARGSAAGPLFLVQGGSLHNDLQQANRVLASVHTVSDRLQPGAVHPNGCLSGNARTG